MSWYEALGWLAGLIASAGVVYAFIKKIVAPIKKVVDKLAGVDSKIDVLVEHDRENYLSILRLSLMNESLPISERIIAGDKYIKEGGNGDCKHYYFELIKEHTK